MAMFEEHGSRLEGVADRLIEVYMHRAGSEDSTRILGELVESSDDPVRDLSCLVVTLAFRTADALSVVDITDPIRRLVPAKVNRLSVLMEEAIAQWAREGKEVGR